MILNEHLPLLDYKAAVYEFTQLPPEVLDDYRSLISALDNRFRTFENPQH